MSKVTVIMAAYNAQNTIAKAIESIINQTYSNYELIIVDDGSSDNTHVICESYTDINDNIILLFQENQGPATARNMALKNVSGDYVCFIDADDWYEEDYIEKMLSALSNGADMAACSWRYVKATESMSVKLRQRAMNRKDAMLDVISETGMKGYLWNKIFKYDLIRRNSLCFDDELQICEDLLFVMTYLKKCEKVMTLECELYNYIYWDKSQSNLFSIKQIGYLKSYNSIFGLLEDDNSRCVLIRRYLIRFFYLYVFIDRKVVESEFNSFERNIQLNGMSMYECCNTKIKFKLVLYMFNKKLFRIIQWLAIKY